MRDFKIAAQLYTVRELLSGKSESEIFKVLEQIKEIGYNAVQISGVGNVDMKLAKIYAKACKDLELEVCATHTGLENLENDLPWIVDYHKMWDCKFVGIGAMPGEYRNKNGLKEFIEKCNVIGEKLDEYGQRLIYHNHKFEFEKIGSKTMMQKLVKGFDSEFVEFEIDTYWVQAGGENPVNWIYKTDGRMSVVHFKDFRIKDDQQQFAEIGKGNLNWNRIIEACRETEIQYAAVEQDSFTDDPIESLRASYKFLAKKGLK